MDAVFTARDEVSGGYHRRPQITRATGIAILLVMCTAAGPAVAGGLTLPVRGVRALERAGALVAGADDADALWLDPAGLARLAGDGHRALLFDVAYVYQTVDYARIDAGGAVSPSVSNQQPGQPLPTLAGALGIGDRLVIAGGIAAPYTAPHRYAADGAQRYSSVSFDSAAFVYVTVGAAYKVSDRLRIGATLTDVYSKIASQIVVSGCPPGATCAPEDRAFDMRLSQDQTDYIAPTGSLGVQYDAGAIATLGLALQAPSRVSAPGKLTAQLPGAAAFTGGQQLGDRAQLTMTLPAAIRAGVELRPTPALRVEAALDVELWSMHDAIAIAPDHVQIQTAGGTYDLGELEIPRDYRTSFAPSLAVEWHGPGVMLGAGYAYETAAAPRGTVSVLTVDAPKHLIGFGGGYEADGWQIGAAAGYAALADVAVPLADAQVPQLAPLRTQPIETAINAGTYKSHYWMAGLRFARRW
jgi:long-subunit fatty acid transport protein